MRITSLVLTVVLLSAAGVAVADDGTWAVDLHGDWSDPNNWVGGIVADGADYIAYFTNALTGSQKASLDSSRVIGHLEFSDGGAYGHARQIYVPSGRALTLSAPASAPTISTITDAVIEGSLAGSQGFIKSGAAILRLFDGPNDGLTGDLHVTESQLELRSGDVLGDNVTLILEGGTVARFFVAGTFGGLAGAGDVNIQPGVSNLSVGAGDQTTVFSGIIDDYSPHHYGSLTKTGIGTLTLSSPNRFEGGTIVQAGTLRVTGADERLVSSAGVQVDATGTFHIDGITETIDALTGAGTTQLDGGLRIGNAGSTFAYDGNFAGSGDLVKLGAGTATLAGDSTGFTGLFDVADGTLSMSVDNAFGSAVVQVDGGYLDVTGGLSACVNLTVGYDGVGTAALSGAGTQLTAGGTAYLGQLAGSSGTFTLSSGTLNAQSHLRVSEAGTGTFEHTGGLLEVGGVMRIGNDATAVGTYNLSGAGEVVDNATWMVVAYYGHGTLTQSGGSVTAANNLYIAERGPTASASTTSPTARSPPTRCT